MTGLLGMLVDLVAKALGSAIERIWADWQQDQAERQIGAASQAATSRAAAEHQEGVAQAAADRTTAGPDDDPGDPFLRRD